MDEQCKCICVSKHTPIFQNTNLDLKTQIRDATVCTFANPYLLLKTQIRCVGRSMDEQCKCICVSKHTPGFQNTKEARDEYVLQNANQVFKTWIRVCKHKSELFTENCICDLSKHSFAFSCFYYFGVPVGFVFYSFAFPKHVLGFTKHKAEKYSSVFGNTNQVFHQNPDLFFPSLTIFGLNLCFGF